MSDVPDDYEKQYLDLMNEHRSEETLRYRKNLTTFSFLIIASSFLKISPTDIDFGGIDLSGADLVVVTVVTEVVLGYWIFMYNMWLARDSKYNGLRKSYLGSVSLHVNKRYESAQKAFQDKANERIKDLMQSRLNDATQLWRRVTAVEVQTESVRKIQAIASVVEKILPALFGVCAMILALYWN